MVARAGSRRSIYGASPLTASRKWKGIKARRLPGRLIIRRVAVPRERVETGLGHLPHFGRELHAMDTVIGIMLVIVGIGLLADKIMFSPFERFLHRRWGTGRV